MTPTICPDCGETMTSSDSGEPEYIPGWYCDNCQTFWSDDDLQAEYDRQDEESAALREDDDYLSSDDMPDEPPTDEQVTDARNFINHGWPARTDDDIDR